MDIKRRGFFSLLLGSVGAAAALPNKPSLEGSGPIDISGPIDAEFIPPPAPPLIPNRGAPPLYLEEGYYEVAFSSISPILGKKL